MGVHLTSPIRMTRPAVSGSGLVPDSNRGPPGRIEPEVSRGGGIRPDEGGSLFVEMVGSALVEIEDVADDAGVWVELSLCESLIDRILDRNIEPVLGNWTGR